MGLPQTLAGIIGLILSIVVILGMSAPDLYPDQSQTIQKSQNNFYANMNLVSNGTQQHNPGFFTNVLGLVGLDGIYSFITNFYSMLVSSIILEVSYVLFFFGIAGLIPNEFYLFFGLIGNSAIIALIKLIFFSGD